MLSTKFKSLLGLCQRAGKVVSGESMVMELFKAKKKISLLILAADASMRSKKEFYFQAEKKQIDIIELGDKCLLGEALGKGERSIIAILDDSFSQSLKKAVKSEEN